VKKKDLTPVRSEQRWSQNATTHAEKAKEKKGSWDESEDQDEDVWGMKEKTLTTGEKNSAGKKNDGTAGEKGGYGRLLAEVKERVLAAQYAAFRAVNRELVALYWDIGRMISKRQIAGMHGDAVVEQLATDLRTEFPGVGGFSRRHVFYMREFYLAYRNLPKVQPLVAQIGWTHNLIVLQRCREPLVKLLESAE
jgi:hypothetical protein